MKNIKDNHRSNSETYREIKISDETTIVGSFDAKTNNLILNNSYQIFKAKNIIYSGCLKIDSEELKFHGQGCYYLNNLTFQGKFIDNKPDTNSQFNVNSTTGDSSLLYQGSINCFFQQHGFGTFFSKSGSDIFSASGIFCNGDYSPNLQYDISKNGLLIYRGQIKIENLRTATDLSLKSNVDEAEKSDSLFLFHGEGAVYQGQKIFRGKFIDGVPDREAIFEIECRESKVKYSSKLTGNFELIIPERDRLQGDSQEKEEELNHKIINLIAPNKITHIATKQQINKIL